jgi:hypothetical protein
MKIQFSSFFLFNLATTKDIIQQGCHFQICAWVAPGTERALGINEKTL